MDAMDVEYNKMEICQSDLIKNKEVTNSYNVDVIISTCTGDDFIKDSKIELTTKEEHCKDNIVDENSTVTNSPKNVELQNLTEDSERVPSPRGNTDNNVPVQEEIPIFVHDYFKHGSTIELSRYSWNSDHNKQQYLRGCLWSPDGTCILTAVNCDGMHVIELPTDLYQSNKISPERPLDILQTAVHIKEGGTVYDYCWYPNMNSTAPETCCWLASRQHEPIHMWDAFSGELRCSYKGYDAVDEVESAISVAFSTYGDKVFGGYKKNFKVFNTDIPGRKYTELTTKYPVSCFGIHKSMEDTIVIGSWNSSINLYDLRIANMGSLAKFSEHSSGVTYLQFGRTNETLFSGARKDNHLIQWDMRNFSKPIHIFNRNVKTNQRIYFDLNPNDEWLVSGDTNGIVHAWNMNNSFMEYQFNLHNDCCNGVGLHQAFPIMATTSGQFHFIDVDNDDKDEIVKTYENSLIFWWIGDIELLDEK